jgi:hypothetical protein
MKTRSKTTLILALAAFAAVAHLLGAWGPVALAQSADLTMAEEESAGALPSPANGYVPIVVVPADPAPSLSEGGEESLDDVSVEVRSPYRQPVKGYVRVYQRNRQADNVVLVPLGTQQAFDLPAGGIYEARLQFKLPAANEKFVYVFIAYASVPGAGTDLPIGAAGVNR